MITLKEYRQQKAAAIKAAKYKLKTLDEKGRIKLAGKTGMSLAGINNYIYGNGKDFETALEIIEA
jgi:DNA-binding transcriptional MerR regulator